MSDDVFPLRLTPFERYMLADDRPEYPMTFVAEFDFQGSIDPASWEAAFVDALERHPLLRCIVRAGRFWEQTSIQPSMEWLTWGEKIVPEGGERIDLSQVPGLRVWMHEGKEQVRLLVQFHHACCDGVGSLQFLGDWFLAYHGRCGNEDVEFVPLNSLALAKRGRSRWKKNDAEPVSRWQVFRTITTEVLKFATRRLVPIRGQATSGDTAFPGLLRHTFPKDVTRRLRQNAKNAGTTLNDLMLRDLFATLAEWNGESANSKGWLQVNMPTSLRGNDDSDLPATNVIGYAFLARQAKDCCDDETLLQGISEETAAIRKWNSGQYFLDALSQLQRVPGSLNWFTSPRSCCTTTVFSNVGDFTRRFHTRLPRIAGRITIGQLTLQQLHGTPPLRPLTRAVFMAIFYAGELTINMRGDVNTLGPDNSRQLLRQFVERLERSATVVESVGPTN